jgi:hypothetical protein
VKIPGNGNNIDTTPLTTPHLLSNAPVILNELSILNGIIPLEWMQVTSTHNHSVVYNTFFSIDNGMTWQVLVEGASSNTINWDTTAFPDGDGYRILVEAINEVDLAKIYISDAFRVNNVKVTETVVQTSTVTTTVTPADDDDGFFDSVNISFAALPLLVSSILVLVIIRRNKN